MEEYEEQAEKYQSQAAQAERDLATAQEKIDELQGQNFELSQKVKSLEKSSKPDTASEPDPEV